MTQIESSEEPRWCCQLQDPFPSWHRRGHPIVEGSDKLVRVDPEADATDGFFIALFVRLRQGKQARKQQQEQAGGEQHGAAALLQKPTADKSKRRKREG
jgi:hypothetical protein